MSLAAAALALAVRPGSEALRTFFLGEWRVSKTLEYSTGGITGTFAGNAEFICLPGAPDTLSFSEIGTFIADADERAFETRSRLLYDFSAPPAVKVSFDSCDLTDEQRTAEAVHAGARYFHSIDTSSEALCFSEHPCGPDVYRGSIDIYDRDEFELVWCVTGPRKNGKIVSSFRKYPGA